MKKFLIIFLSIVGILALRVPHALAEFNSTPDVLNFEVDPSATGWSVMATGTGAYFNINGFPTDAVGTSTNPIIHSAGGLFSVANGTGSSTYAIAGPLNADIAKAVPDGSGGFYITGSFTTMDGVSRTGLAHVSANNAVDPNFNPTITASNSNLLAQGNAALSPDGSVLYVSSPFLTAVNSQSRDNLAAIKTSDGSVVAGFNPTGSGSGNAHLTVLGVSPDGTKVYVLSSGATINGAAHGVLAELNAATGATIAGFDPAPNGSINTAIPNSTATTLYVSGSFTSIGGISRTNVAALNISDGTGVAGFNATPNGTVNGITLSSDNNTLYATGGFTTIGGHSHLHVAALHTSDGTDVVAFAGSMLGGTTLALTPDGTKLYVVGGGFSNTAELNTSNGSTISTWPQGVAVENGRYTTIAFASDGNHFFAGGTGQFTGGFLPSSPLKLSTIDDSIDPSFNVTVDSANNNLFSVLSPDGTIMYLGGFFNTINGVAHVGLAAVHTSDGSLVAGFNPILDDDEVDDLVISKDGSTLYIGGFFDHVDGVAQSGLAAVRTSDGSLINSFAPDVDSTVYRMELSPDQSKLYIAGFFDEIGGDTRTNGLGAVNTSDGSDVTTFNPDPDDVVQDIVLSKDGSKLYIGGFFHNLGVTPRNFLGVANTSDGSIRSDFDPEPNDIVNGLTLYPDGTGNTIWVAGSFSQIGGQNRDAVASLNTTDGSVNAYSQSTLLSGGWFTAFSGDLSKMYLGSEDLGPALFIFTDPTKLGGGTVIPTVTAQAASSLTDTTATLNGNITATGGANPTVRGFVYGTTVAYGATTTENGSFPTGAYLANISSLTCATTYHFKAYATNTAGAGYSTDSTFTTSACAGGGGGGSGGSGGGIILSGQGGHSADFPTLTLTASPTPILPGKSSTLTWASTNTTSCTASGGWSGAQKLSGSKNVSPATTTSYTITCNGLFGTVSQSTTVVVSALLPTLTLTASSTNIILGKSSTLTWASTNTTTCTASGGWTGTQNKSGSKSVSPATTTTYTLLCSGTGGSIIQSATVTVTIPIPTLSLTASSTNIILGKSSTLKWITTNVTACTASGGWTGAQSINSSKSVSPATTTIYTLLCSGVGGSVTQSVTVTVTPPLPTLTLTTSSSTLLIGKSATLTWKSTNTTSCTATGGWTGTQNLSGTKSVTPATTTIYSLDCLGAGGVASQSVAINVYIPLPVITFTTASTTLTLGKSTTIKWSTTNATSCTASGGFTGPENTSGSLTITPTTTTTYTLTCTGAAGTSVQSVTVNIYVPPPALSLTASSTSIVLGKTSTLKWSSANVTTCTASSGWTGTQNLSGSKSVSPATTTSYTLLCTGAGGSVTQSVMVTVIIPPPTLTLTASPLDIVKGKSSTLKWTSTNTTTCTASDGWTGTQNISGSKSVSPTTITAYTITCAGTGSTVSQTAVVRVFATAAAMNAALTAPSTPESSPSGISVATLHLPILNPVPATKCLSIGTLTSVATTYVSDANTQVDGHNSVVVNYHHPSWTATVPGANWIWSEDPLADAVGTTTKVFTRTFSIKGTPKDLALNIAADNSFSLAVNGHLEGEDLTGYNYRAPSKNFVIPASDLTYGVNTLTFVVTNFYMKGGTYELNPAGLTYSLNVPEDDCPTSPTQAIPNNPSTLPNPITSPIEFVTAIVAIVSAFGGSVVGKVLAVANNMTDLLPGVLVIIPAIVPLLPQFVTLTTDAVEVATTLPLSNVPVSMPDALPVVADFAGAISLSDGIEGFISQMVDYILSLFGFHRRKNHLGVVFDSQTGEPIRHGYVTLHDAATGNRVSVSVTDLSGAYGFFIKPGSYVIRAAHSGFSFPSANQSLNLSFAAIYDNVYRGEVIEVKNEAEVVGRNIAMDRTSSYKAEAPVFLHRGLRQTYNILGSLIFALGFISSLHGAWVAPGAKTIIVLAVYILVTVWSLLHRREWGRIYDRKTGKLLAGFLLELTTTENKIIDRTVTDHEGRFLIHASRGNYLLKVYEFGRTEPLAIKNILIGKEGVVNSELSI